MCQFKWYRVINRAVTVVRDELEQIIAPVDFYCR